MLTDWKHFNLTESDGTHPPLAESVSVRLISSSQQKGVLILLSKICPKHDSDLFFPCSPVLISCRDPHWSLIVLTSDPREADLLTGDDQLGVLGREGDVAEGGRWTNTFWNVQNYCSVSVMGIGCWCDSKTSEIMPWFWSIQTRYRLDWLIFFKMLPTLQQFFIMWKLLTSLSPKSEVPRRNFWSKTVSICRKYTVIFLRF